MDFDVRTGRFRKLRLFVSRWAAGQLPFLVVVGPSGVGKSKAATEALAGQPYLLIRGKESAFNLYVELYRHRGLLILIDDAEELLKTAAGRELIRDLTETIAIKNLRWGTRSKQLESLGIPNSFQTTSRVLVLTNSWRTGGIADAISSRASTLFFEPAWDELYKEAGRWFQDQEVLDFVFHHLSRMTKPDLRRLIKASDLRRAGFEEEDWTSPFRTCFCETPARRFVAELLADPAYTTNAQRLEEFVRCDAGDRSTFFRLRRELVGLANRAAKVERILVRPSAVEDPAELAAGDVAAAPDPESTAGDELRVFTCS